MKGEESDSQSQIRVVGVFVYVHGRFLACALHLRCGLHALEHLSFRPGPADTIHCVFDVFLGEFISDEMQSLLNRQHCRGPATYVGIEYDACFRYVAPFEAAQRPV